MIEIGAYSIEFNLDGEVSDDYLVIDHFYILYVFIVTIYTKTAFSIDYRKLRKDEEEEYFELFAYGGWTHVCSSTDMHIF
ncbi:DUF2812 domain-containing protein [Lysinibacillus sp. NPDC092081]|uniref:DUF2812 domain-containing protein n=1 Tax=Lysinibacillus sp. NPDC092081 TaxID=3364131 RepID=UPI0038139AA7